MRIKALVIEGFQISRQAITQDFAIEGGYQYDSYIVAVEGDLDSTKGH
jgi:hypothetical protein